MKSNGHLAQFAIALKHVCELLFGALMTNLLLAGSMYMLSGELWLEFRPHPVSAYEPEMTWVPAGQTATIVPLFTHEDALSMRITSL